MISARGISLPAKSKKRNTVRLILARITLKGMSALTQLQMECVLCLVYLQTHTYAHIHTHSQMEFSIKSYINDKEPSFWEAETNLFIALKRYWHPDRLVEWYVCMFADTMHLNNKYLTNGTCQASNPKAILKPCNVWPNSLARARHRVE